MEVKFEKLETPAIPKKPKGESWLLELPTPFEIDNQNSKYLLYCHKCGLYASIGNHKITWDGGLVTIHPSIVCPNPECDAHYWIKGSQIA